ncbi:Transcriptional regulator [Rubellimicrobium thermophilum DSM 16684]|uniref:Transcriptional regulator n=1 Tax=Rubellimicrobium thermophilum DSM 16684 TaxID=1123069 RepID=S9SCI2_9RHOB|nr:MarR family winged helix-turn-helix transcriptional regulator [Rubellimicrobium thermophilum]EPX87830.1 Transcriptional regulator [Rubellimicrobium thermophilum DSM 16684]
MSADRSARQIATALSRLSLFLRSAGWQAARAAGLTPTQAEILTHLARRGPARGAELAAALGVTAATLSDSAAALVAKGLAERRPDPADARATLLRPTGEGAALAGAMPEAPAVLLEALAGLPQADRAGLARGLMLTIAALQTARAIPVQRICATCRYFRPHVHSDAEAPHHCDFVDAAFGDAALRLDCGDHEAAPAERAAASLRRLRDAA